MTMRAFRSTACSACSARPDSPCDGEDPCSEERGSDARRRPAPESAPRRASARPSRVGAGDRVARAARSVRLAAIASALAVASAALALAGCTPSIGDKCTLSTDCSIRGDRLCDTSQPGGYCTIFNCGPNACPSEAACILFHPAVPGCPADDRAVARTARSFCMVKCSSDSDCRSGYQCVDARNAPWSAVILDDDQSQKVCVAAPVASLGPADAGADGGADAGAVCQSSADGGSIPGLDAGPRPADAGGVDASDAGAGADADAGRADADAGDAATD